MRIDVMKADVVKVDDFELPENHRLTLNHMNKEDARRWTGEEDPWHTTITRSRHCETCSGGKDVAWFKGHATTPTEAIVLAVKEMEEFDVLIRNAKSQRKDR